MSYNIKMDKKKNIISAGWGILALLFLAAAIIILSDQYSTSQKSEENLEMMRTQALSTQVSDTPEATVSAESSISMTDEAETLPSEYAVSETSAQEAPLPELTDNPYRESFLANEDMIAWLKIDGTVIDYPVMWTPRDETYYLERSFDGRPDQNGCLLLDTDSSLNPLTTNLIIHGHNMKSGAMFGSLLKYSEEAYCREHSQISLYAEDREHRYEVIAVFRSQVYKKTDEVFKFYKFFQADTQEEFDDFYQNIKALSLYETGVTAAFGDHFITLSTCAYHVTNGRFVVVAKELESGEHYRSFRENQGN